MRENSNIPQLRFPGFTGEWEEKKLGEVIKESKEVSSVENEDILLTSSIDGMFLNSEVFSHQRGNSTIGYRKISKGMLVLSAQNLHLGNANVNMRFDSGLVSPAYKVYKIIGCLQTFMFQWIKRDSTKQIFLQATTQGASECRKNVVWEQLYQQIIPLPSLAEQQKIADCLSALDEVIGAQAQKTESLREYKRGLMQKLFPQNGETTPKLRFPGFTGEWEEKRLGEIFEKHNEKNDLSFDIDKIISVANMYFKQDADVSNDDYLKTYNIFRRGDIAYEGHKSSKFAYGRLIENTIGDGIVSHVFDVYRPIISDYCIDYWKYAINYEPIMRPILEKSTIKSTMMNNLKANDFLKQIIRLPLLAEQQKIADCLSALDEVIGAQAQKTESLREYKRGLMQQLFPQPAK